MRCPVCDRTFQETESAAMPFCCERCRLIDLGRWLDEKNTIPFGPSSEEEDLVERSPKEPCEDNS